MTFAIKHPTLQEDNGSPCLETTKHPEDALYAQWLVAADADKPALYARIRDHLVLSAERLSWMILKQVEDHKVQEAANEVMLAIDTFKGNSKFSTFAQRLIRNTLIDELRYQRKCLGHQLYPDVESELGVAPVAAFNIAVQEHFSELSDRDKQVVLLKLQGMRSKQIAEKLGLTEGRISQILSKLKLAFG